MEGEILSYVTLTSGKRNRVSSRNPVSGYFNHVGTRGGLAN
jgi:hypothetical protein